jgi:hypothetical protein
LLAILAIVCMVHAGDPGAKRPTEPIKINAEDLCSGKYVIIGRLGKPCGELSNIRGVWSGRDESTKEGWRSLRITHIDDKEIVGNHQVVISEKYVQPTSHSKKNWPPQQGKYEGRVYERCGYLFGKPAEVERILDEPSVQTSQTYSFESYLYLVD